MVFILSRLRVLYGLLRDSAKIFLYQRGKIFNLNTCQTAILKNRGQFVDILYKATFSLCNADSFWKQFLLTGIRSEEQCDKVSFEYQPMVLYCAKQSSSQITKTVLNSFSWHNPIDIAKVLELSYSSKAKDIQKAVLSYCGRGDKRVVMSCAQVALMNDHSKSFGQILDIMSKRKLEFDFSEMVSLVESKKCQLTLDRSRHRHRKSKISVDYNAGSRNELLVDFIDSIPDTLTDEWIALFKSMVPQVYIDDSPDNRSLFSGYVNAVLSHHIRSHCGTRIQTIVRALSMLGADIDHTDHKLYSMSLFRLTPLSRLLDDNACESYPCLRELVELLINENSSIELNPLVFKFGIKRDESLRRDLHQRRGRLRFPRTYVLDATVRPLFGHKFGSSYALNFLGPLLSECGYPVERGDVLDALDIPSLHVAEREYYEHILVQPRSLQFHCRNRLRRHFKGREIQICTKCDCSKAYWRNHFAETTLKNHLCCRK